MISTKLIHLIENNWDEIVRRLIRALRQNPDLKTLAQCADAELSEWCSEILRQLGDFLARPKDDRVRQRFEQEGRSRWQESVPLQEAVLRAQLLHQKIVQFIHEQELPQPYVQLYAEEQLEARIALFFDSLVYGIVRGYEAARRRSLRVAS